MILTRLTLRSFRCFEELAWEPQPGLNFILGPNAQGKTSILEAACMLLRLKSPRTNILGEMLRFGEKSFCVEGLFEKHHQKVIVTPEASSKYELFCDDVAQKKNDYLATGTLVWFGNEDIELVHGTPGRRRDFLDSAGLQLKKEYGTLLRFYERALRSRNLLLREGKPRREIEAYDLPLAESGEQLIALRAALVEDLKPHIAAACEALSQEKTILTYEPGAPLPMIEALAASREEEERLHYTQVGPHRDDFLIFLNELPAGPFASEGQRRTLAIALKLGLASLLHQQRSSAPLLLLDDIFGELDPMRRHALLNHFPKTSQAFFTTTALAGLERPPASTIFELERGKLTEL
ncbi:MAG: DNA replication and repair protein RecF [Verrucomicrobia bacterium]|nr:DNA replication and repair protein RecF [Verrucomicrobiota bacterium]